MEISQTKEILEVLIVIRKISYEILKAWRHCFEVYGFMVHFYQSRTDQFIYLLTFNTIVFHKHNSFADKQISFRCISFFASPGPADQLD